MPQGTIPERLHRRSVIKHIPRRGEGIVIGAGYDYSETEISGNLISASGFADDSFVVSMTAGELAAEIAFNNFAASVSAIPQYMNIFITAGTDCPEEKIRYEMTRLPSLAKERGVRIIGGNTAYSGSGFGYSVIVNITGASIAKKSFYKPAIGDKVIAVGYAGQFGATELTLKYKDILRERFSEGFLRDVTGYNNRRFAASGLEGFDILLHDVSYGGIYRALYDISEWTNLGITAIHEHIPVRQEDIEICEFFNINPYMLMGAGAFVILCHEEASEEIFKIITDMGIAAGIAGTLTEGMEKVVLSEVYSMKRFLTPYAGDEIFSELRHVVCKEVRL